MISAIKTHKRYFIIAAVAVLLVLLSAFVTRGLYAYYTDGDSASNQFTIGGSNVEVVENYQPPKELIPGVSFTKEVSVKNLGPSSAYVRIKAVFTTSDMAQWCTVDWNTEDFIYNEADNFWYYTKALEEGESTPNLFNSVTLSEDIPESAIEAFDILIYTEAYQSTGFDDYQAAWDYYVINKPTTAVIDGGSGLSD
jgi:hypothetical protein